MLAVTWVHRSRSGWDWIDGVDAPLAKEGERYRVTVQRRAGRPRVLEVAEPRLVLEAANVPGAVARVQQVGGGGACPGRLNCE